MCPTTGSAKNVKSFSPSLIKTCFRRPNAAFLFVLIRANVGFVVAESRPRALQDAELFRISAPLVIRDFCTERVLNAASSVSFQGVALNSTGCRKRSHFLSLQRGQRRRLLAFCIFNSPISRGGFFCTTARRFFRDFFSRLNSQPESAPELFASHALAQMAP